MTLQLSGKRRRAHHVDPAIPEKFSDADHSPRGREVRLLDEALHAEARSDGPPKRLIAVAGFGPRRRDTDRDDRVGARGQLDRIADRALKQPRLRDVMVGGHHRYDRLRAQPIRDQRHAVGDRDRGAPRLRFDDQIARRKHSFDCRAEKACMIRADQYENPLWGNQRLQAGDRIRQQRGLAVEREQRLGPPRAPFRPEAGTASAGEDQRGATFASAHKR
jgi:hypothetical protein